MRPTIWFALLWSALAALPARQAAPSPQDHTDKGCIKVTEFTVGEQYSLQNCDTVTLQVTFAEDDKFAPGGSSFTKTLKAGETIDRVGLWGTPYKVWTCRKGTPIDQDTNEAPKFAAKNIVCKEG